MLVSKTKKREREKKGHNTHGMCEAAPHVGGVVKHGKEAAGPCKRRGERLQRRIAEDGADERGEPDMLRAVLLRGGGGDTHPDNKQRVKDGRGGCRELRAGRKHERFLHRGQHDRVGAAAREQQRGAGPEDGIVGRHELARNGRRLGRKPGRQRMRSNIERRAGSVGGKTAPVRGKPGRFVGGRCGVEGFLKKLNK